MRMAVVRTRIQPCLVQPPSPHFLCTLVSYETSMLTVKASEGSKHLIPQRIRVGLELHLLEEGVSSGKYEGRSYKKGRV
jgi:hypothetical protein